MRAKTEWVTTQTSVGKSWKYLQENLEWLRGLTIWKISLCSSLGTSKSFLGRNQSKEIFLCQSLKKLIDICIFFAWLFDLFFVLILFNHMVRILFHSSQKKLRLNMTDLKRAVFGKKTFAFWRWKNYLWIQTKLYYFFAYEFWFWIYLFKKPCEHNTKIFQIPW